MQLYREFTISNNWRMSISLKLGGDLAHCSGLGQGMIYRRMNFLIYFITDESRTYLDSCAGCVFRKRTVAEAEELMAKIAKKL